MRQKQLDGTCASTTYVTSLRRFRKIGPKVPSHLDYIDLRFCMLRSDQTGLIHECHAETLAHCLWLAILLASYLFAGEEFVFGASPDADEKRFTIDAKRCHVGCRLRLSDYKDVRGQLAREDRL